MFSVTLSHLEDHANSVKAFEKSIALAPDDITIRLNYVNFFVSQNETDLSKYHLNVAEDLAKKIQNLDKEVSIKIDYTKVHYCSFGRYHVYSIFGL